MSLNSHPNATPSGVALLVSMLDGFALLIRSRLDFEKTKTRLTT